jgi:putative PEP-CTERM system histidine kinase
MVQLITPQVLVGLNLAFLFGLLIYLTSKAKQHPNILHLELGLAPLILFQSGSYLFGQSTESVGGATLIVFGILLTPLTFVPLSHCLSRTNAKAREPFWITFYIVQILLLAFAGREIIAGRMIEWVTGILDQPIIMIGSAWRYYFVNVLGSNILALLLFDRTIQHAGSSEKEKLKFLFIAILGFTAYFSYLSVNIFLTSYISQSMLNGGAAVIFCGLVLLVYSFFRYPLWQVKVGVSRNLVFGILSVTAGLFYLVVSGSIFDILRLAHPVGFPALLPVVAFVLVGFFLTFWLSAEFRTTIRSFVTKNIFRNKYDYRDLWMKFSDKSGASLNLRQALPRVAELIGEAMFVRQVAIWLRSPTTGIFHLTYCHDPAFSPDADASTLKLDDSRFVVDKAQIYHIRHQDKPGMAHPCPVDKASQLSQLGIEHLARIEKGNEVLALLGIGRELRNEKFSAEDEQLLTSISNQLGNFISTHKLSEELLLSREWDSFNRFASFILHDLKNLATLQGMTLENAKHLSHNPNFMADAFATFHQTTDKMINLIASLSVQRGQLSLKQQPVNILEVLSNTFDDLKITQRNGVQISTAFPPKNKAPMISGDPELLQKAFTNLLLNAIQSLPQGKGAVEVTVSDGNSGTITAAIRDTGCGIPPERLQSLFRPFQTTKEKGMGIGLCHTRSIIEVHGGQIRIESEVNTGTKVEVDLPTA